MNWSFEIGHGDIRGYVTPMDGGACRMVVSRPGAAGALFVGLATVARAVESFCAASAQAGQPVPPGARRAWEAKAAKIDAGRTA